MENLNKVTFWKKTLHKCKNMLQYSKVKKTGGLQMKKLLAALGILVFALVGCGASTEGIYTYPSKEVEGMDVAKGSYSQSFQLWEDIYSGLFRIDGDGELINEVVSSYELSDDELTYTFTLNDDFYWTDNTGAIVNVDGVDQVVTASDFEFAWKRAVDPSTAASYSFIFEPIQNATKIIAGELDSEELGVTAIDDTTLEVVVTQPTPYFTSLLSFGSFYPISEVAVEQYGEAYGTSETETWYNGPFYTSSYDSAYQIELLKNENYPHVDQVQLEGVNYRTMEDTTAMLNSFKTGEVDYTLFPTKEDYAAAIEDGSATDALTGYMFFLYMNNSEDSILSDSDLRHALFYAFDRDSLVTSLYGEMNQPIDYVVPADLTTSSYDMEYRDYAESGIAKYDMDLANESLNTYMEKNGITDASTIELDYITSDTDAGKKTAEAIKAMYEQSLGITINITSMPSLSFYDAVDAGSFDLQTGGWGPDYADPSTYFSIWQTSSIGQVNGAHYSNADYDSMYLEAVSTTEPEARMAAFAELETKLMEDAAFIPFYQKNEAYSESEAFDSHHLLFQKTSNMYTSYNG